MRIRMNTTLMHPRLGAVNPGQVIDLPEEEARALLRGRERSRNFPRRRRHLRDDAGRRARRSNNGAIDVAEI